jgi:homoserine kinase
VKPIRIDVPATSANLGPGFDSLGMALDIADAFVVGFDSDHDDILMDEATCTEAGVERSEHYACRAYRAYAEDAGVSLPGARFSLEGRIPVGKGLGSSAAAIVAGLAAAAHATDDKNPEDRIIRLAAELEGHPDNSSAAILGGVTVAFCDRDQVHAFNVVNHISLGIALFVPDDPLPTVQARAVLPSEVPVRDAIYNLSRSSYLVAALAWGRWERLASAMRDRIHQPYRTQLIPGLDPVIEASLQAGACGAALSGGGPSVIALGLQEHMAAIAATMEAAAHESNWSGHTIVTNVRSRGVRVMEQ